MIKAAIEKIQELTRPVTIFANNGRQYSTYPLELIKNSEEHKPETLMVFGLTGFMEYIEKMAVTDSIPDTNLAIHIRNATDVALISQLQHSNQNKRFEYVRAYLPFKGFNFNAWMPLEDFVIALQTQFVAHDRIDQLLNFLGNIASDNVAINKDDKFSQSVELRTGIRMKETTKVQNPIHLRPWRTFREISQPAVNCLLRLRQGHGGIQCSLWIADGECWQLDAIISIKKLLNDWLRHNSLLATNLQNLPIIG